MAGIKKKRKRKEKRCDHHNFKLQRELNEKKNLRRVLYVIRGKECMWSGEKKEEGHYFISTLTTLSVISDCHQAITSHTTNINRYIDKEAEEELTAIIPLVNTTTVSLWTAGVLLRPYLTLPDLIRDQPDRLRYNVY